MIRQSELSGNYELFVMVGFELSSNNEFEMQISRSEFTLHNHCKVTSEL